MKICKKCNTALGALNDDPDLIRKAAEYVEKGGVMSELFSN